MIELYTFRTPNGKKASVMLEEVGLAYNVHVVRVGDTQKPEYAAISKIRRIPTIVDSEGPGGRPVTIFESGAIMIYLAQKTGSSLYPNDPMKRLEVDQWLFHGQSSFGMLLSQTSLFESRFPQDVPPAKEFYGHAARNLYDVVNTRLGEAEYLAGDYSVADIAHFTWVAGAATQKIDLANYPNVKRWYDAITARPAVQRGMVNHE